MERNHYMAMLRTAPWSAAALFVALAICVTVNAPLWLAAVLMAAVVIGVPLWRTRAELGALRRRDR